MEKLSSNSSSLKINSKSENILLALIIFVGACFRLLAAHKLSLSNDELSALTRARFDTFYQMIEKGVYIDFHPAGIQSLIYYWLKIFGDNPFVFRLPFVISGVLSIYFIFALGKKWFSSFTGLWAAALFSVFQFSILYSFFARPYSPGLFFGLIAAYSWTILFFPEKNSSKKFNNLFWWLVFILSMIGCTHTHYFSFVFAGGLGLSSVFFLRKDIVKPLLLSGCIILLAFLPEWEIFQEQLSTGDIGGWLASPGTWYLPEFFIHIFNDSKYLAIGVLLIAVPGIFLLFSKKRWNKFHNLALGWFLFSFLTAYLYSILRHPVIQFSTLYFTLPFLLFILGSAVEAVFSEIKKFYLLIPFALFIGTVHTTFSKKLFSKSQFGVFKEIALDIKRWEHEYGVDSLKTIVNVINPEYLNYYFRKIDYKPEIFMWKLEAREQLQRFSISLDSISVPYFCFAWSNSEHPYEIIRMLRERYPVVLKRNAYYNSADYVFSKNGVSVCEDPVISLVYDLNDGGWKNRAFGNKDALFFSLDSLQTFGPGFQKSLKELGTDKFRLISTRVDFKSAEKNSGIAIVISFDSSSVPKEYHSLSLDDCNLNPGQWQRAYLTRVISKNSNPELILNTYLFNKGKSHVDFKNYEITIEDWDDPYQK